MRRRWCRSRKWRRLCMHPGWSFSCRRASAILGASTDEQHATSDPLDAARRQENQIRPRMAGSRSVNQSHVDGAASVETRTTTRGVVGWSKPELKENRRGKRGAIESNGRKGMRCVQVLGNDRGRGREVGEAIAPPLHFRYSTSLLSSPFYRFLRP